MQGFPVNPRARALAAGTHVMRFGVQLQARLCLTASTRIAMFACWATCKNALVSGRVLSAAELMRALCCADELATKLGWSDELNALERQWKEKRGKAVDDEAKDAEVEEPQADKLVSQSATTADTASAGTAAATSTTPPPAAPRPSQ